jgi:hypothetical protein
MRLWALLVLAAACARGGEIRGAALLARPTPRIVTWGDELRAWPLSGGPPATLRAGTNHGSGGCAVDANEDGLDDLLLHDRAGRMVLLAAPAFEPRVVEAETEFADCAAFMLGGQRGAVVTHLYAQPRFYLFPAFEYKELYSIYTASEQGGLLAHDVDRDGLPDLFLGNYWMRNPGRLDEAWRLFAINTIHDTPQAARAALALWRGRTLFWAESLAAEARIRVFTPPPDVRQLWVEHRLPPLDQPRALLAVREGVLIGHAGGIVLEAPAGKGWRRSPVEQGFAVLRLFAARGAVWAVTPSEVRRVYLRR